jgi:hypothetical protein
MREIISVITMVLSFALLVLAQLTSIGYIVYEWAYVTTFPLALWGDFILWLKMVGAGIGLLVIALLTNK